jgi:hypothetical protein
MAIEKVKTQISWRMLGRSLFCDFPGGESVSIDIDKVHESWRDFILTYGIKQWAKDKIAGMSYSIPAEQRVALLEAQVSKDVETETAIREAIKFNKMDWMKNNVSEMKTEMFKNLKALEELKTTAEKAERENKAQVEARVKAETVAKMIAGLKAAGMSDEVIATITAGL